jgi:hypothetical protein
VGKTRFATDEAPMNTDWDFSRKRIALQVSIGICGESVRMKQ